MVDEAESQLVAQLPRLLLASTTMNSDLEAAAEPMLANIKPAPVDFHVVDSLGQGTSRQASDVNFPVCQAHYARIASACGCGVELGTCLRSMSS